MSGSKVHRDKRWVKAIVNCISKSNGDACHMARSKKRAKHNEEPYNNNC